MPVAEIVEQYQSIQDVEKAKVLKEMERLAQIGWRIQSFGWSNGLQGGWYALMTRLISA